MGFLTRLLIPRKVRRATHPVRAVKRGVKKAVVPKSVRKAMWTAHQVANPVDTVAHAVERSLTTKRKPQAPQATVYTHEGCSVRHRSVAARDACRNGGQSITIRR